MDKKLKSALYDAFEAQKPMRRDSFLKTLPYPKTTYREFFIDQLGYIGKRVWLLSAMIVLVGYLLASLSFPQIFGWQDEIGTVWISAAILPFLSLITISELSRSDYYRMAEIEMSCKYSLYQIMLARITILGSANILLLIALLFLVQNFSPYGIMRIAIYLCVPYLLSCGLCLSILNRTRGREGLVYCATVSGLVSMMDGIFSNSILPIYSDSFLVWWLCLLVASIILIGIQIQKMLEQMEEKRWTYSLGN